VLHEIKVEMGLIGKIVAHGVVMTIDFVVARWSISTS
jgi:hypothetical protein